MASSALVNTMMDHRQFCGTLVNPFMKRAIYPGQNTLVGMKGKNKAIGECCWMLKSMHYQRRCDEE